MPKLEKEIQKEIIDYLNANKIYHVVIDRDGIPDILVCYKGRFIGLENKKPKTGRAQGHQLVHGREIARNGGISAFPRSLEDVKKVFRKVDNDTIWER